MTFPFQITLPSLLHTFSSGFLLFSLLFLLRVNWSSLKKFYLYESSCKLPDLRWLESWVWCGGMLWVRAKLSWSFKAGYLNFFTRPNSLMTNLSKVSLCFSRPLVSINLKAMNTVTPETYRRDSPASLQPAYWMFSPTVTRKLTFLWTMTKNVHVASTWWRWNMSCRVNWVHSPRSQPFISGSK